MPPASTGGIRRRNPLAYLAVFVVILILLEQALEQFSPQHLEAFLREMGVYETMFGLYQTWWPVVQVVAVFISIALLIGIFYCRKQIIAIRKAENEELYPPQEDAPAGLPGETDVLPGADDAQSKWQEVLAYVDSENPSDWRQAILEADIMLEEMLDAMTYDGEGVGEKLKQASKAEFTTLDKAWEAHKVRNAVAHEGASYRITQREARRVTELFRQVFQEFSYI